MEIRDNFIVDHWRKDRRTQNAFGRTLRQEAAGDLNVPAVRIVGLAELRQLIGIEGHSAETVIEVVGLISGIRKN